MRLFVAVDSELAKAVRSRKATTGPRADTPEDTGERFVVRVLNEDLHATRKAMAPFVAAIENRLFAILREEGVEAALNNRLASAPGAPAAP